MFNDQFLTMFKKFTNEAAKIIGEQLGFVWDKFGVEQFRRGMAIYFEAI